MRVGETVVSKPVQAQPACFCSARVAAVIAAVLAAPEVLATLAPTGVYLAPGTPRFARRCLMASTS